MAIHLKPDKFLDKYNYIAFLLFLAFILASYYMAANLVDSTGSLCAERCELQEFSEAQKGMGEPLSCINICYRSFHQNIWLSLVPPLLAGIALGVFLVPRHKK